MRGGRGGLRKSLIIQTWQAILIAYGAGKFYNTAVLMRTITNYLGITIPALPFKGNYQIKIDMNYINYCEQNLPHVSAEVDKWLAAHSGDQNGLGVSDEDDGEND